MPRQGTKRNKFAYPEQREGLARAQEQVEDFYNENDPSNPFKTCLGCRMYVTQCLEITNSKRESSSDLPDCKTCMSNCHSIASKIPRENIPIKNFLQNPEDPNSKVCKNCLECKIYIKNLEQRRIEKIKDNGDLFCGDCKVAKTEEEMAPNLDGTLSKCKICKQRDVDHWAKRYYRLFEHFRKLQLDRIIEKEASCEICKCIFIKPDEGEFICTKLQTRNENGENFVDYEGRTYLVKDFLLQYSDLLEYRILDFDHLPSRRAVRHRGIRARAMGRRRSGRHGAGLVGAQTRLQGGAHFRSCY